jgi:DNA-binding NtrC family response regulator
MIHPHTQVKVLIAERTLNMAELIARSLKNQGYAIAGIVNSPEKAIEFVSVTTPDVVLLDLPLYGELDTFTAGWKILSEAHCPVIYMTTRTGEVIKQVKTLYSCGFLIKPFTAEELKATIEQTIQRHQSVEHHDRSNHESEAAQDDQFLGLLTLASSISPLPRIAFEDDRIQIYTHSLSGAAKLKSHCYHHLFPFSYQIFVWRWQVGQYRLYAQRL